MSPTTANAIPGVDLHEVETAIGVAIRSGDESALKLLGHGEVTIVLGWPATAPEHALKRVPPFDTLERATTYIRACEENFDVLRAAGIGIWPTALHVITRSDGRAVVYHHQPIADTAQLGTNVLRAAPPADHHPFLEAIAVATKAVTRPDFGFDVNAANWLWDGATATQIDFSSPFLLDERRKDLRFDTAAFLREYPAAMRPVVKRELLKLVKRFTTPEGALERHDLPPLQGGTGPMGRPDGLDRSCARCGARPHRGPEAPRRRRQADASAAEGEAGPALVDASHPPHL